MKVLFCLLFSLALVQSLTMGVLQQILAQDQQNVKLHTKMTPEQTEKLQAILAELKQGIEGVLNGDSTASGELESTRQQGKKTTGESSTAIVPSSATSSTAIVPSSATSSTAIVPSSNSPDDSTDSTVSTAKDVACKRAAQALYDHHDEAQNAKATMKGGGEAEVLARGFVEMIVASGKEVTKKSKKTICQKAAECRKTWIDVPKSRIQQFKKVLSSNEAQLSEDCAPLIKQLGDTSALKQLLKTYHSDKCESKELFQTNMKECEHSLTTTDKEEAHNICGGDYTKILTKCKDATPGDSSSVTDTTAPKSTKPLALTNGDTVEGDRDESSNDDNVSANSS